MEDKIYEQGQGTWQKASEVFNKAHPILSDYVGFIILYALSGVAAGFIVALLQSAVHSNLYSEILPIFFSAIKLMLQIILGFYAFRYVIKNSNLYKDK